MRCDDPNSLAEMAGTLRAPAFHIGPCQFLGHRRLDAPALTGLRDLGQASKQTDGL